MLKKPKIKFNLTFRDSESSTFRNSYFRNSNSGMLISISEFQTPLLIFLKFLFSCQESREAVLSVLFCNTLTCVCVQGGTDSPKSILEFIAFCNPEYDISEFRYKIWHSQHSNTALKMNLLYNIHISFCGFLWFLFVYVCIGGRGGMNPH